MRSRLAIAVFGRFSVVANGVEFASSFTPRVRRVLAHLALRDESTDRALLAAQLWPDDPESAVLGQLRRRLSELSQAFTRCGVSGAIVATRDRIALHPDVAEAIDAVRYARGGTAKADTQRAGMYAEPLFPGVDDEFVDRYRRRFQAVQIDLLETLLREAEVRHDAAAIERRAYELLALDPDNERATAAIPALQLLGQPALARRLDKHIREDDLLANEPQSPADAVAPTAIDFEQRRSMLSVLVERSAELRGAAGPLAFDALEENLESIRAALDAAILQRCDVELGVRALAALSRFFFDRGMAPEAAGWYAAAIPLLTDPSPERSEALYLQALVGRNLGRAEHNLPAFEEAIEALERCGDRSTLAKALLYASNAARMTGSTVRAESLAKRALEIVEGLRDAYLTAFAHSALGTNAYARGDFERALREFETARDGFAAAGAVDDEALMAIDAGRCRFARGETEEPERAFRTARERALATSNRYVEAHADVSLALIALDRGDLSVAGEYLARTSSIAVEGNDVELEVIAVEAAGEYFLHAGEWARARDALVAADGVRAEFLIPRPPSDHDRFERVRTALADTPFAASGPVASATVLMRSLLGSVARASARRIHTL
jgi:DNA-binding SARP family transcriptional activator